MSDRLSSRLITKSAEMRTSGREKGSAQRIEFENRLVAFVDILGWAEASQSRSAHDLFRVLNVIAAQAEIYNEKFRQNVRDQHGDRANPLFLAVQFAFFSDCFVFSMPTDMAGRIYDAVSRMIGVFLRNGFALRGGITAGPLYHHDQVIFGPALVAAYRLESKQAKFARVVIDEDALNATGVHEHEAVMKDHLGNWVVDPFPVIAKHDDMRSLLQQFFQPDHVISIIGEKFSAFSDRPAIRDIWRFQAEVCALSFAKYGDVAVDWVSELRRVAAIDFPK